MKFIYPNNGVLSSASSELDSAPAANITEIHANNSWIADTEDSSPTITIEVESGSAVLIYKILADAITVDVKTVGGSIIMSGTWTLTQAEAYGVEKHIDHVWLDYPNQAGTHLITVALTKGSYYYTGIGVIIAGKVRGIFTDPNYGDFSLECEDHSLLIQLAGGVEHPISDNIQRIYPATVNIREDEEADALNRFGKLVGKSKPFACKMHETALPKEKYLLYARFDTPPKLQPTAYRKNTITFTLKEFL